ncbi:MAG: enoyl-CoA hydratase [Acidimicrobiia bacterium]|nr:enoyl-CoA hydratase [Acidimicrobiia bacterium]
MIHSERRGAVVLFTIDRTERRNALDIETVRRLADAVHEAHDARVLALTGAGGHFCAGADLGGVEGEHFVDALRSLLLALTSTSQPVVAAVDGAALGAGTQLAVACDLRVATPAARFGIPAAKLGLMVDHWSVQRLTALAGEGPARAMLLAAETFSGEDAERLGFVQRIGDLDAALDWAQEIAALAPLSIAGHKLALNGAPREEFQAAFDRAWASADLAEGMAAFRERRAPEFRGR